MVTLSLTAEQIDQLRNIAAVGGKWLMAAFTALGGLAGIAKIITTFVARKKPVKLNQSDYEAIANAIVDKTNGSIEINMSSEIDKATRNRLTEVEKVNGELVKACKQLVKSQKAIANAIVDKTNGSIEINMSSEIDKATRNRLTEVEKVNGELVKACKQLVKSQKAIANAVSDFKTISTSARDELKASMNDLADGENGLVAVETPKVDKPIVKIEKVAENENKPLY